MMTHLPLAAGIRPLRLTGVVTGDTGVDMSTPLLSEGVRDLDRNPLSLVDLV